MKEYTVSGGVYELNKRMTIQVTAKNESDAIEQFNNKFSGDLENVTAELVKG